MHFREIDLAARVSLYGIKKERMQGHLWLSRRKTGTLIQKNGEVVAGDTVGVKHTMRT
jgi:hypothetical protein